MKIYFESVFYISSESLESCFTYVTQAFEKTAEEYFMCLQQGLNIDNPALLAANSTFLALTTIFINFSQIEKIPKPNIKSMFLSHFNTN